MNELMLDAVFVQIRHEANVRHSLIKSVRYLTTLSIVKSKPVQSQLTNE